MNFGSGYANLNAYGNLFFVINGGQFVNKGFYENKQECTGKKQIQNVVVNKEFSGECKRASLGRYCYMQGVQLKL